MACGFWYTSHMKQLFHLNQLRTTLQKTDLFKKLFITTPVEPKEERETAVKTQMIASRWSMRDSKLLTTITGKKDELIRLPTA